VILSMKGWFVMTRSAARRARIDRHRCEGNCPQPPLVSWARMRHYFAIRTMPELQRGYDGSALREAHTGNPMLPDWHRPCNATLVMHPEFGLTVIVGPRTFLLVRKSLSYRRLDCSLRTLTLPFTPARRGFQLILGSRGGAGSASVVLATTRLYTPRAAIA